MAALTRERNTPHTLIDTAPQDAPVQDNVVIYNGALTCAEPVGGFAVPAADTANYRSLGVADETADNTIAGHTAGGIKVPYRVGIFSFDTTGVNAITQADVGKLCYVLDDHTVVRAAGTVNSIIAGRVEAIDANGQIWVDTRMKS